MASQVKYGSFAKPAGGTLGTQAVTGVGFQPKALLVYSLRLEDSASLNVHVTARRMMGMAVSPLKQYSQSTIWSSHASFATYRYRLEDAVVSQMDLTAGALDYRASLVSFDADGFTLDWTDNLSGTGSPTNAVIGYIAIGGDVQADIALWPLAAGLGNHAVTGLGFQPTSLFSMWGGTANTAVDTEGSGAAPLGFGSGDTLLNQFAMYGTSDNSNTSGTLRENQFITTHNTAGTNRDNVALASLDVDGFTLNTLVDSGLYTGMLVTILAISGVDVAVGALARSGAGADVVSGLGFSPDAVASASVGHTVQNAIGPVYQQIVGFGDGTVQRVFTLQDDDTTNPSLTYQNSGLVYTSLNTDDTIGDQTTLTSLDVDGFTLGWVSGVDTERLAYIALAGLVDPSAPDTPTGLSATAVSDTQIDVSWNASTGADSYDLRWSLDDAIWNEIIGVTSPHAHSGLTAETMYFYQVRAVNAVGPSAWSTSVSATTEAPPPSETLLDATTVLELASFHTPVTELGATTILELETIHTPAETLLEATTILELASFHTPITALGAVTILEFYSEGQTDSPTHLSATTILEMYSAASIGGEHRLSAITVLEMVSTDVYSGPGTGLQVGDPSIVDIDRVINDLRDGDRINVLIGWAGVEGRSGVIRVMRRSGDDAHERQDIEPVFQPIPDPTLASKQRGGKQPVVEADRQMRYFRQLKERQRGD